MTATPCQETANVEPARDGRLPAARAAWLFEHARGCVACAREIERLEALRAGLSALAVNEPSAEEVARGRAALLVAARSDLAERRPAGRRFVAVAAALAIAASVAVMLAGPGAVERARSALSGAGRGRAVAQVVRTAQAPAQVAPGAGTALDAPALSVEVQPRAGADWSRQPTTGGETVVLATGELRVVVRHRTTGGRVVVRLPDGELEDIGTIFVVDVEDGRTRRVLVEQGLVKLRLRDRDAVEIRAGESWEAPRTRTASEVPASAAPASPPPCPRGDAFDSGLAAFSAADYGKAVADLRRFQRACVHDRRNEDAAYLIMVALARAGQGAEAAKAAGAYISRFPRGFRRQEAEKVRSETP